MDDPLLGIDEHNYIHHLKYREKRDSNPDYKRFYPVTLIKLKHILQYIDEHYKGQFFLGKIEIPALAGSVLMFLRLNSGS